MTCTDSASRSSGIESVSARIASRLAFQATSTRLPGIAEIARVRDDEHRPAGGEQQPFDEIGLDAARVLRVRLAGDDEVGVAGMQRHRRKRVRAARAVLGLDESGGLDALPEQRFAPLPELGRRVGLELGELVALARHHRRIAGQSDLRERVHADEMGIEPGSESAGEIEPGAGARADVEMDEDRLVRHGFLHASCPIEPCWHAAAGGI